MESKNQGALFLFPPTKKLPKNSGVFSLNEARENHLCPYVFWEHAFVRVRSEAGVTFCFRLEVSCFSQALKAQQKP